MLRITQHHVIHLDRHTNLVGKLSKSWETGIDRFNAFNGNLLGCTQTGNRKAHGNTMIMVRGNMTATKDRLAIIDFTVLTSSAFAFDNQTIISNGTIDAKRM